VNDVRISSAGRASRENELTKLELEKLQTQLDQLRAKLSSAPEEDVPAKAGDELVLAQLSKEIVRSRRRRDRMFDADLFGEPAWDILLELYAAQCLQEKLSVSSVCFVSAVPPTTALRWLVKLEQEGWVRREGDALDARRYWVFLTEKGSVAMRRCLSEMTISPV